VGLA
jgi:transketolase